MSWLTQGDSSNFLGTQDAPEPGFFEGSGTSIFRGVASGFTRLVDVGGALVIAGEEALGDVDEAQAAFDRMEMRRKYRQDLADGRQGALSRFLFGVTEAVTPLVGGISVGATAYGLTEATSELAKGKDLLTAEALGLIRGGTLFIGAKLPAALAPKYGIAKSLGYGAVANAGLGAAQRAAEMPLLPTEEETAVFDPEQVAIDAALGAIFAGFALRGQRPKAPAPAVVDAALDARAIKGVQDASPGIPRNLDDLNTHMNAVADTAAAIDEGKAPDYTKIQERISDMPQDPRIAEMISRSSKAAKELEPESSILDAPEKFELPAAVRAEKIQDIDYAALQQAVKSGKDIEYGGARFMPDEVIDVESGTRLREAVEALDKELDDFDSSVMPKIEELAQCIISRSRV